MQGNFKLNQKISLFKTEKLQLIFADVNSKIEMAIADFVF